MNKTEHKIMKSINPEKFINCLPHGSGIDCSWGYTDHKNNKITFNNSFHAMNEHGYYDGYIRRHVSN